MVKTDLFIQTQKAAHNSTAQHKKKLRNLSVIQSGALKFKMGLIDHNEILHTSRQFHCRDVCKISMWSVENISDQINAKFCGISNIYIYSCWMIGTMYLGSRISIQMITPSHQITNHMKDDNLKIVHDLTYMSC